MLQRLMDIDVGLLLTLDALYKDGNATKAARRLGLTQPTVSARLVRLRAIFEDELFIPAPSGRGMVPTPHARALQPELERLMERLLAFSDVARAFDPAQSERVFRISASDNPVAILAPDLVPLVKAAAPNVRLSFTLPQEPLIVGQLEQGEVDLYIGALGSGADHLINRTLFDEKLVTAQRKGHPRGTAPLELDEFCGLEHILVSTSGGSFSGLIDTELASLDRERRVGLSIQSYSLVPLILSHTDYVCTLPHRLLRHFGQSLDLFEPPVELQSFKMSAYWHGRVRSDPAHRWLRDVLFQAAGSQGRGAE